MGYKIIKGWSEDSPMDYPLPVETGNTILPGHVYCLTNSGTAELGTYASNGTTNKRLPFFCIDTDAMTNSVIGLMGNFMVELDSDLYAPGVYTSNLEVTCVDGKISIPTDQERIVAVVVRYFNNTGKLVITWQDN